MSNNLDNLFRPETYNGQDIAAFSRDLITRLAAEAGIPPEQLNAPMPRAPDSLARERLRLLDLDRQYRLDLMNGAKAMLGYPYADVRPAPPPDPSRDS